MTRRQPNTTAAERRAERRLLALCEQIRQGIDQTTAGKPDEVVAVFAKFRETHTPSELGDAFWWLDEKPGHFPGYGYSRDTGWHAKLRICRNTPSSGHPLFALFRS